MCTPLPVHKTGEGILNITDLNMAENGVSWKLSVDICTDGARSMAGKTHVVLLHMFKPLHQNALVATG
jgi:hypothetical protein